MNDPSLHKGNTARAHYRARRRRLYRIRQVAIELGVLAVLAAVVAVPIWLLSRGGDAPPSVMSTASTPAADVEQPPSLPPYPVADGRTVAFTDKVTAPYAILWDVTAQRVVAARSPDTVVYPASVTKVMTLLVAVEEIEDFTDTFTMTYEILHPLYLANATIAGFVEGEAVLLEDLLYGAILPSGADACQALAEYVAGTEAAFAQLMNEKAAQLGLKNTHFVNTSGLHDANHYTTAADMAVVMQAAMANPHCRQVLSAVTYTTACTPEHPEGITLYSTMFSRMYGTEPEVATIIAGKTGYTSEAKHTMASYAQGENGHDYVLVTMYGKNKWAAIYDSFAAYGTYCPASTTITAISTTTTVAG